MIFIILAIALALRLIGLNQSLWLDEGINVNVAYGLDFKNLILHYSLSDFHPPLFHAVLKTWILLFGKSEIAVRMLSITAGVATVFAAYLIGKKLFGQKTALTAAILLATSPLHIYYSQEARMYSLAAFFASLSCYFFISILKKDTITNWFGFVFTTALMLYTDYLPYFLIPVYFIYLLINKKRIAKATFKAFIPAFILILILITPWLFLIQKQIEAGLSAAAASPAWAQVVGAPSFQNLLVTFVKFHVGRISHDNNFIYALLFAPAAIFSIALFSFSLLRLSYTRVFLWFWFAGPIFLAFIAAYFVPIFAYFRFIFVLPALYLIWACAINTLNWKILVRFLLAIALIINVTSVSIYFLNPKFQRENWRSAANYIHQNFDDKTIVLFESNYTIGPFDYYNNGRVRAYGALDSFNAEKAKVKEKVTALTSSKNKIFLFQYLAPITDPQELVFQQLTEIGFKNTGTYDFAGVGFIYEFKR